MECFNEINAPVLRDSLVKIQEYYKVHNIESSAQDNFRVLLAGGFSNFYAVEATVRDFFKSSVGVKDKRFEQPFKNVNRSFAISRGAALIAQGMVEPIHVCPYNIGYIYCEPGEADQYIDKDAPVIEKGTKIADVKSPKFSDITVRVRHKSGKFRIFMDDGRPNGEGRLQAALDESVTELFPSINDMGNEYKVGFSLNKNLVPTIYVKDAHGKETQTSLNKLLERISVTRK
jgi:molecular chaperone DnaK